MRVMGSKPTKRNTFCAGLYSVWPHAEQSQSNRMQRLVTDQVCVVEFSMDANFKANTKILAIGSGHFIVEHLLGLLAG